MDSGTEGAKYLESVLYEREKLIDNSKLISARIVREMQQNNESFLDFGLRLTEER
jgi:gamma-glutamylcysteine synthetase